MKQTESYIKYDGGALWSCESGQSNAQAIMLCSGGPGCCDYLKPVADMLDSEYRVIRFEQRGCGRSTADGKYSLATAVEDMEHVRLYYGIEQWIIGGHSWGANLAFVYAMTYPERVQALLYVAGTGIHDNRHWSEQYHRNAEEIGEQIPEMDYPFNGEVNKEGNRSLREFGRAPDLYQRISRMEMPALFVIAENDIRPSWPAEQFASLMLNTRCVTISDASHYIWLDNAAALQTVLLNYMSEQSR